MTPWGIRIGVEVRRESLGSEWWRMTFSANKWWVVPWVTCTSRRTSEQACIEDAMLVMESLLSEEAP